MGFCTARCELKRLGKYEIIGELGRGATGIVYQALDPIISRKVALKTITANIADDPNLLQRFYREAQSAGGLQHLNIITIYDVGEEGGLPYIAMELVEGQNLEQVISSALDLPLSLKLGYGVQTCRALDYAHKRGIVHRDVKPGNVMVNREGIVKVVDFGIARVMGASRAQTGMLIGTFAYMSPDLYNGERADERSDIWSFGVLLYELVSYKRPFVGETPASLMQAICNQEPRPLREVALECPPELEVVVHRILRKSANDRFQSMEDVLLELDPIWKGLQSGTLKDLVERSRQLIDQHEYSQARDLLRQALQVDSTNTQIRNLLERVNAEVKRILIRPRAQECVEKGKIFLQEGKLQEAKAEVEAALHLDSAFEPALELHKQVQRRLDRAQLIAEWLQASKQRLAEGLPEEARALLAKVLEAEPGHEEAYALQGQVTEEIAAREKGLRLLDGMQRARALWIQQSFAECIELLTELQKAFADEAEVGKLLEAVREDQAEHHKQQRLGEARRLLAARQFEECLRVLAELKKEYPADLEIGKLLHAAAEGQAEQDKQRPLSEARLLLAKKRYDDCITLLREMRERFPEDTDIGKLLNTAQEDKAEEEKHLKLEEARNLLATQRFADCIALLTGLKKNFPRDPEVPRLLEAARHAETEQRKHKGLAEARNLLAARNYDECLALLTQLQKEFPSESEGVRLLEALREEQAEQEKRKQLAEARNHLAGQRHTEALAILDALLAAHPQDAAVIKLRNLVVQEHQEKARFERLERERSALKRLVNEKKYPEAISGAETLLRDFPSDHELARLVEFARNQQAQIEQQAKLRRIINEVQSFLQTGDFDAAFRASESGMEAFPGNADLLRLRGEAERRRKERETRRLIEQRIREIRAQINRDNFSDAVSLAQETLATLGPNTDVSQLLTSAQVELHVRERKKEQARQLETVRIFLKSGKTDEAARVLDQGLETEVFEPNDPRVEKAVEEIQAARKGVAPAAPTAAPAPPSHPARENVPLVQAPSLKSPAPVSEGAGNEALAPQAAAAQPAPVAPPAISPPAPQPPATRPTPTPPAEAGPAILPTSPSPASDRAPKGVVAVPEVRRAPTRGEQPVPTPLQVRVPLWMRPAAIGGAVLAGVVLAWVVFHKPMPPKPLVDNKQQIELQQRKALDDADRLVAANDLEAARQTLEEAAKLNGPLAEEIQKKQAAIEESMQNQNLRNLRQKEEQLWQRAKDDANSGRFAEAQSSLQQILALGEGGLRKNDAQQYLLRTIPARQQEEKLFSQARQALQSDDASSLQNAVNLFGQVVALEGPRRPEAEQQQKAAQAKLFNAYASAARQDLQREDFHAARLKAGQIHQNGGDAAPLFTEIDQAEQKRLTELENQFNQLKQSDDDAAAQQLSNLQRPLQALSDSAGPRSSEAKSLLNNLPAAIREVHGRAVRKSEDTAYERNLSRYQQASSANDKSGLEAALNGFQSIALGGGSRAADAQKMVEEISVTLARLNQPASSPTVPSVKSEPPSGAADRDAVLALIKRYAQAFEKRSPDALLQTWPTMGKRYAGYKSSFESASSIRMQVQTEDVNLSGDGTAARVTAQFTEEYTPTGQNTRIVKGRMVFQIAKPNGTWVITDVQ